MLRERAPHAPHFFQLCLWVSQATKYVQCPPFQSTFVSRGTRAQHLTLSVSCVCVCHVCVCGVPWMDAML